MVIIIIITVVVCGLLMHEFGNFVDDVIPDYHKEEDRSK